MQFTIHIELFQMQTVQYASPGSFILSARHYKNGFEELRVT
jgi:hypothetical protein